MPYDPNKHHRRSIRLKGYDYAQNGAYFITICAYQRQALFGEIIRQEMHLNTFGEIVLDCWNAIPAHFPYATCDAFVVMPNHIHGIILITTPPVGTRHAVSRKFGSAIPGTLSTIVGSLKSAVTRQINRQRDTPGGLVWQDRFYDRIIRSRAMLDRARIYVLTNPLRWEFDQERPEGVYM